MEIRLYRVDQGFRYPIKPYLGTTRRESKLTGSRGFNAEAFEGGDAEYRADGSIIGGSCWHGIGH
jgi:hypothetical protein